MIRYKSLLNLLQQGKNELIRCTLSEFLVQRDVKNKFKKLRAAYGMWKNHQHLLDVQKARAEFDRF